MSSPTKTRRKDESSGSKGSSTSPSKHRKEDPVGSTSPSKSRRSAEDTKSKPVDDTKRTDDAKSTKRRESSRASKDTDQWLEQELAKVKGKQKDKEEKPKERGDRKEPGDKSPTKERSEREEKRDERGAKDEKSREKNKSTSKEGSSRHTEAKEGKSSDKEYEDDFENYDDDFESEGEKSEGKADESKEVDRDANKELLTDRGNGRGGSGSGDELEEEIEVIHKEKDKQNTKQNTISTMKRATSPTLAAVRALIDAENAAATPSSKTRGTAAGSVQSGPGSSGTSGTLGIRKVVDVRSSKAQQEAVRRMTRARELSKIISFESVVVDLLDDKCDKDIQTNPPQSKNKGIQVPGDGEADEELKTSAAPFDAVRLGRFLTNAAVVIGSILEENIGDVSAKKFTAGEESEWSSSYIKLNHPILAGRKALQVEISHFLPNHVLVVYSSGNSPESSSKAIDSLENLGILCMWNLDSPEYPSAVMVTYLTPCSVCLPSRNTVIAGTVEGSLLIWDLREPPSMHKNLPLPAGGTKNDSLALLTYRFPTYSTDGLKEAHHSVIERIQRIGLNTNLSTTNGTRKGDDTLLNSTAHRPSVHDPLDLLPINTDEESGSAFKIATLDDTGTVNVWVVVELDITDSTTNDMDLHVSVGGRVRMVHTASMRVDTRRAFDFTLHPLDPSRVLVAGDTGRLVHGARLAGSRLGTLPPHYVVRPNAVNVVAVSAHPLPSPSMCAGLILTACADGYVVLHHIEHAYPIRSWDVKARCLGAMWSTTRALQFFVITHASLLIFDLSKSLEGPIVVHDLGVKTQNAPSLIAHNIASRWAVDGKLLPLMCTDSSVVVHRIIDKFSAHMKDSDVNTVLSTLLSAL